MKHQNHFVATVLSLLLLTATITTASGSELVGMQPESFQDGERICSIYQDPGHADTYILTNKGLYSTTGLSNNLVELFLQPDIGIGFYSPTPPADTAQHDAWESAVMAIVGHNGSLYGLNNKTGGFFLWDGQVFKYLLDLQWDIMINEEGDQPQYRTMSQPVLIDDTLYILSSNNSSTEGNDNKHIIAFDITTGKSRVVGTGDYVSLVPYKDGKVLLLKKGDISNYFRAQIVAVTRNWDAMDLLVDCNTSDVGALGYDEHTDTVFYLDQATLMCFKDGKTGVIQTIMDDLLPEFMIGNTVGEQEYVIYNPQGKHYVLGRVADASVEQRTLYIEDYSPDEASRIFLQEHPGVQILPVTMVDSTPEKIYTAIATGDDSVDVLMMSIADGYGAMKKKGYLADISGSVLLTKATSEYTQKIQDVLSYDGKLYAVPRSIVSYFWTVQSEATIPLPQTYKDYLELEIEWANSEEDKEEYLLASPAVIRSGALRMAIIMYILQNESVDAPLTFSENSFIETLEVISLLPPDTDAQSTSYLVGKSSIFRTMSSSFSRLAANDRELMMPPQIVMENTPVIYSTMDVYVVNPNSRNLDLAIEYLETVTRTTPIMLSVQLNPSLNESIIDPEWERIQKEIEGRIEELSIALPDAGPTVKKDLLDEIAELETTLNNENLKWIVTSEDIRMYRDLAPYLKFAEDSLFLSYTQAQHLDEIVDIAQQYIDGAITMDTAIAQMNRYSLMVYQESI